MSGWFRRVLMGGGILLLPCVLLLSACSDDPILGPSDGETEEGGSYSAIERLARPDTAESGSTRDSIDAVRRRNPERF